MVQNEALQNLVSQYTIVLPNSYLCFQGIIVRKIFSSDGIAWSVYLGNSVFSKRAKAFVMDEMPSSRDADYFNDKRFKNENEATKAVVDAAESVSEHFLHKEVSQYVLQNLNDLRTKLQT